MDSLSAHQKLPTVSTFRFLGSHISAYLTWTHNTNTLPKKAQQRLHFLLVLRKNNLDRSCCWPVPAPERLSYHLSVWYTGATTENRKAGQRVFNNAQKLIGCPLPPLGAIISSSYIRKTRDITDDPLCTLVGATGQWRPTPPDSLTASPLGCE